MEFKKDQYKPLKMNLQFFAEPDDDPKPDDEPTPEDDPKKVEFTEEELQRKVESESDRKLQSALEKERKKMREELQKELAEQKKEAERLAKLSAKEREEAEFKKRQDALDQREQELQKKELKAQAVSELHDKQLPSSFADFLLADDGEKTFENIGHFKKAFDEAVEGAVTERLKGDAPKAGNGGNDSYSLKDLSKMNVEQINKNWNKLKG